jgi:2-polyprenyl-6-hydroxyphenyl methylase / 3-demethylubiquinone-9 3-methyltransferase
MAVNNAFYAELGERWYQGEDTPVALLRAEAALRNPWIAATIAREVGGGARVLDLGCGAGFLANDLAARGHRVVGLDADAASLAVAARHGRADYLRGDARALPWPDGAFDVVCAMDFLEHVTPAPVVAEAARVLAPGGLFFFHTFDRNPLAWLVVIKGVEWFVAGTPRDMHVLELFIRPAELAAMCRAGGLEQEELRGVRPRLDRAFLRMLRTRHVPPALRFVFTRSTRLGYCGFARKTPSRTSGGAAAARSGPARSRRAWPGSSTTMWNGTRAAGGSRRSARPPRPWNRPPGTRRA